MKREGRRTRHADYHFQTGTRLRETVRQTNEQHANWRKPRPTRA